MWRYKSDWYREYASDRLISSDDADESRRRIVAAYLIGMASAAIGIPLFYCMNYIPLLAMFSFIAAYSTSGVVVSCALLRSVRLSWRRWRPVSEGVGLRLSGVFSALEFAMTAFIAVGIVVTMWMATLSVHAGEYDGRRSAVGVSWALLSLLVYSWSVSGPHDLLVRRMMVLRPDGVRIFREGEEVVYMPRWGSPKVMGVRFRNGVTVVNALNTHAGPIEVSLRLTPISYVRFEQLLSFYVDHPELRHELATHVGLARVKDLMNRYPWDIEEEL